MLIEKEELQGEEQNADKSDESKTIRRKSSASSLRKKRNSIGSSNSESCQSIADNEERSDEKNEVIKELEASSRGKISGSILLNYFKSANHSCTLAFLVASFLLTQILVSVADIWISYW